LSRVQTSWELKVISFLAIVVGIAVAQSLLFPILLSFFLYLLFNPVNDLLIRCKFPKVVSAAIIVLGLLGLISYGISSIMGPASDWIDKAPANFRIVENKITVLKESFAKIIKVARRAQEVSEVTQEDNTLQITPESVSIGYSLFNLTTNAIFLIFTILVILFFLLIYFRSLIQNIEKVLFNRRKIHEDNKFVVNLKNKVSHYMLLFTLICAGLGAAVAFMMWILGLPSPFLWGIMAMFLTYIPYVGHIVGIVVITFVSLVSFDSWLHIITPPFFYMFLAVTEGQIITPILLGNRLNLNPLIVFLNIFFWGWIWGISGIVISVPLLVTIKLIIENVPEWAKYKLVLEK
jgi:predicted PurR-regulated permease PerM